MNREVLNLDQVQPAACSCLGPSDTLGVGAESWMWIWLPRCLGGTEGAQGVDVDVDVDGGFPKASHEAVSDSAEPLPSESFYSQLVEHLSSLPEYKDTFSVDLRVFRISCCSK